MPDEQNQPEVGLDATANATPPEQGSADIEQPGEGVPAGPEVAVDEYVKSLGLDYDDELNFELVSDEMLPQVQARLAQVNPQASRRKGLRYTDYHEKRQREAEEAKERVKKEAEEAVGAELPKGILRLAVVSPVDISQVRKLEEYLRQVQNLRLVLIEGSVDEGTKIVVSVENPIHLMDIIRGMPPVEQVVKKDREIQIMLKAE